MPKQKKHAALYQALLQLKTPEEAEAFFEDLCTITECQSMEQRFQVVQLLDRGMVYNDILKETGVSTATISRVNRALHYGSDGYRLVLDRMKKAEQDG